MKWAHIFLFHTRFLRDTRFIDLSYECRTLLMEGHDIEVVSICLRYSLWVSRQIPQKVMSDSCFVVE